MNERAITTDANPADDILHGAEEIANFLRLDKRAAYHAVSQNHLPVFRIGAKICARKSTLLTWIESQELQAANDNKPPSSRAA